MSSATAPDIGTRYAAECDECGRTVVRTFNDQKPETTQHAKCRIRCRKCGNIVRAPSIEQQCGRGSK